MAQDLAELKKEVDAQFSELRMKRKTFIVEYKEKVRAKKIDKIRNSILSK